MSDDNEMLLQTLESVANMMRGMTMDLSIPSHARVAMLAKAAELDEIVEKSLKNGG